MANDGPPSHGNEGHSEENFNHPFDVLTAHCAHHKPGDDQRRNNKPEHSQVTISPRPRRHGMSRSVLPGAIGANHLGPLAKSVMQTMR